MTPAEFKAARRTLGLSVPELSFILNIQERTIRKWELDSDPRPVNPLASRVMEWMLGGYEPPQWPDSRKTDRPLDPQYFSVRAFNGMRMGGITTEGQLSAYFKRHGIDGLRRLPNFGNKAASEVAAYLAGDREVVNAGGYPVDGNRPDDWPEV